MAIACYSNVTFTYFQKPDAFHESTRTKITTDHKASRHAAVDLRLRRHVLQIQLTPAICSRWLETSAGVGASSKSSLRDVEEQSRAFPRNCSRDLHNVASQHVTGQAHQNQNCNGLQKQVENVSM